MYLLDFRSKAVFFPEKGSAKWNIDPTDAEISDLKIRLPSLCIRVMISPKQFYLKKKTTLKV